MRRRINIQSWRSHGHVDGHVRDVQFVSQIKGGFGAWGVPTTQCHQSNRCGLGCDQGCDRGGTRDVAGGCVTWLWLGCG